MPPRRGMVLLLCVCLFAFIQVNGAQEYKVRLRIKPQADTTVESLQSTMCAVLEPLQPAPFASVDDCKSKLTVTTDMIFETTPAA